MKYTTSEIEKAYKESPLKVKQILDDVWVANTCSEIGKDLNLRIDKVDALIRVVGLTLLNIVSVSNFVKVIESELSVSTADSISITKKVDQLIFQKIREVIISEDKNYVKDILNNDSSEDSEIIDLMEDIENRADDNVSFKDKFNKVVVQKVEERIVDPYRESID